MVRRSNPGGGEIFRTCPDRPWGPPSLLYNGYRVFPGGKEWPGCDADPSTPSSAMVMKEQSYTSTPPMGRTACTEPQCLYKSALYLYLVAHFDLILHTLHHPKVDFILHGNSDIAYLKDTDRFGQLNALLKTYNLISKIGCQQLQSYYSSNNNQKFQYCHSKYFPCYFWTW